MTPDPEQTSDPVSRRATEVEIAYLDDEAVLYDTESGVLHHLNATGVAIWERYQNGGSIPEIADDLAEAYGADPVAIGEDVVMFLAQLTAQGLIRDDAFGALGALGAPGALEPDAPA